MTKFKTAFQLFRVDKRSFIIALFVACNRKGILNFLSDKTFLQLMYLAHFGKKLDLASPKTFNEKLQWLKLYDRNPKYCSLVDKFAVKEYISKTIGDSYIIPTLGLWETVEDIDWKKLPDQFVIKCTHDSGSVVVCKDKSKLDIEATKDKLRDRLKKNMYYWGREWAYSKVKPRIIVEKYMNDGNPALTDYKFMCFNGQVKCTFLCTNRFSEGGVHVTFYDSEWNKMPFERQHPADVIPVLKPKCYDEMVTLAEKLATGIPFVRVDFYDIGGKPYFGEMTFYPGNGTERFTPEKWDYILGDWIELPKTKSC